MTIWIPAFLFCFSMGLLVSTRARRKARRPMTGRSLYRALSHGGSLSEAYSRSPRARRSLELDRQNLSLIISDPSMHPKIGKW